MKGLRAVRCVIKYNILYSKANSYKSAVVVGFGFGLIPVMVFT